MAFTIDQQHELNHYFIQNAVLFRFYNNIPNYVNGVADIINLNFFFKTCTYRTYKLSYIIQ